MITALAIAAGVVVLEVAVAVAFGRAIRIADERSSCCPHLEAGLS